MPVLRRFALLIALLLLISTAIAEEPRYQGVAQQSISIRALPDKEATVLGDYRAGSRVLVLDVLPEWLKVIKSEGDQAVVGYVLRHRVWNVVPISGVPTLPYGAMPAVYVATLSREVNLYSEPDVSSDALITLPVGVPLALLSIEDGWGTVLYWRQVGYLYLDAVETLTPIVRPEEAAHGDLLAAFQSFYDGVTRAEDEAARTQNLVAGCLWISRVLQPKATFSFNDVAGPYRPGRGYVEGPSYLNGREVPSMGGGVCQVSSTLYNVLLPLPQGLTILERRSHGPSGATYLPHGVDAAVGNANMDLVFRNDFSFPVRMVAQAEGGVNIIALYRE